MRGDQWKRLLEVGRVDLLPDGWLKVETHKDLIKLIDGHAKINLITNIAEILWWECATLYAVMRLEKPTTNRIYALCYNSSILFAIKTSTRLGCEINNVN